MSENVTYGSYTFPSPTPFVGYGVSPVYIGGKLDHSVESIELIGNLTGQNLSGLHLQKMQMISGLMSEFQNLTISHLDSNTGFNFATPESISFNDSDLTTVLPYSASFICYESGDFSEFMGITEPVDTWSYNQTDGKITNVTHTVSAKGLKIGPSDPLQNAIDFVTGRATGCRNISTFQTGSDIGSDKKTFLVSRLEDINKKSNIYKITENYKYNTYEEGSLTDKGVFTSDVQIAFDKDAGLKVDVKGQIQGAFDANKKDLGGLVTTGLFSTGQATEMALNAVASSLSDYESGSYTFIQRGPSNVTYDIDSGSNIVSFNYSFTDPENLDQEGDILHKKRATISASKDKSTIDVNVNGEISYNGISKIIGTGDPATGERFKEIDSFYSGVIENSGFLNLATEALQDFRGDATGYHISGNYLNQVPVSKSITKSPQNSVISYSVGFDNRADLSSGTLSGLKVNVTDKKPLRVSGIQPSVAGFAKQLLISRTAGEYSVSASCEADTGDLRQLIDVVSGHMTGFYTFDKSNTVDDETISFKTSRYY